MTRTTDDLRYQVRKNNIEQPLPQHQFMTFSQVCAFYRAAVANNETKDWIVSELEKGDTANAKTLWDWAAYLDLE